MSSIQDIIEALSPQQLARLMSSETMDAVATFDYAAPASRVSAAVGVPAPVPAAASYWAPAPASRVSTPLKVLNGFMAFRSYYSSIFDGVQLPQKSRSALIKTLWDHERGKIEWALIGKAYSGLRDDVGKTLAPLREFLRHACPAMDMDDPSAYLATHNWIMQADGSGNVTLTQTSVPAVARRAGETEDGLLQKIHASGYRLANGDPVRQHRQRRAFQMMTAPAMMTAPSAAPDASITDPDAHDAGILRLIRDIRADSLEAVHRALGTTPGEHLGYNYVVHWLRDPQDDGGDGGEIAP